MLTIGLHNAKGGCGKTSTAVNLAVLTANAGIKTLLIDTDPQGNASMNLLRREDPSHDIDSLPGLAGAIDDVVSGNADPDINVHPIIPNLDILPGGPSLAWAENAIAQYTGRNELVLVDILAVCKDGGYELVIVDTKPSSGWLVWNAVIAADRVVIPVEMTNFGINGLPNLSKMIEQLAKRFRTTITVDRIVITKVDGRIAEDRIYAEAVEKQWGSLVAQTKIRTDSNVRNAQSRNLTVFDTAPQCRAAEDYRQLGIELLGNDFAGLMEVRNGLTA